MPGELREGSGTRRSVGASEAARGPLANANFDRSRTDLLLLIILEIIMAIKIGIDSTENVLHFY